MVVAGFAAPLSYGSSDLCLFPLQLERVEEFEANGLPTNTPALPPLCGLMV